jgi:hypothetical protein
MITTPNVSGEPGQAPSQALQAMEKRFGHLLTQDDRLIEPKVNEAKWENRTAWERNAMVESGLLQPTSESGRGVWALTASGKSAARSAEVQ